jgi:hypothetical protein
VDHVGLDPRELESRAAEVPALAAGISRTASPTKIVVNDRRIAGVDHDGVEFKGRPLLQHPERAIPGP